MSLFSSQWSRNFVSRSGIDSGIRLHLKACIVGQIDASHLESLPGNEAYQLALELVNALASKLVKTAIA